MPNYPTPDVRNRTIVPDRRERPRVLSSKEVVIAAGSQVSLANWQGKIPGGSEATVYGSVNPFQGTNGIYGDVTVSLRSKRGGIAREESFPWPANGFIRRVVAEEIVVAAKGAAIFSGLATGYMVGASVQDGVLPEDCPTHLIQGSAGSPGLPHFAFAPTGAREWRAAAVPGGSYTPTPQLTYADVNAIGGTLVASTESLQLAEVADWTPWPSSFAGIIANASINVVQIEWRR